MNLLHGHDNFRFIAFLCPRMHFILPRKQEEPRVAQSPLGELMMLSQTSGSATAHQPRVH